MSVDATSRIRVGQKFADVVPVPPGHARDKHVREIDVGRGQRKDSWLLPFVGHVAAQPRIERGD
eukprot:2521348-Prymnesium_polylepis.1